MGGKLELSSLYGARGELRSLSMMSPASFALGAMFLV